MERNWIACRNSDTFYRRAPNFIQLEPSLKIEADVRRTTPRENSFFFFLLSNAIQEASRDDHRKQVHTYLYTCINLPVRTAHISKKSPETITGLYINDITAGQRHINLRPIATRIHTFENCSRGIERGNTVFTERNLRTRSPSTPFQPFKPQQTDTEGIRMKRKMNNKKRRREKRKESRSPSYARSCVVRMRAPR